MGRVIFFAALFAVGFLVVNFFGWIGFALMAAAFFVYTLIRSGIVNALKTLGIFALFAAIGYLVFFVLLG